MVLEKVAEAKLELVGDNNSIAHAGSKTVEELGITGDRQRILGRYRQSVQLHGRTSCEPLQNTYPVECNAAPDITFHS